MANAKRASMREGPLAALFRKTEESEDPQAAPPRRAEREETAEAPTAEPPRARRTGRPHPALDASPDSFGEQEVHVPTPRERLRQAFSSDIPENIMERP